MKMKRRLISLITVTAVAMTMIIAADASVFAATQYEVPVKVTEYYNSSDPDDPVWVKQSSTTYKYDARGNLKAQGKNVIKWKYKKKKPVKAKVKRGKASATLTYKKGKLSKAAYSRSSYVKFSYRKGWISKYNGNHKGTKYSASYKYKFYGNGMPKSITEKIPTGKSSYKTTLNFNDKGLITMEKTKYAKETFVYQYDAQGRTIARTGFVDGDVFHRTVYEYNGARTSNRKTYMGVMNGIYMKAAVADAVPSPYPLLAK